MTDKVSSKVDMMLEFHKVFGVPINTVPTMIDADDLLRRVTLISAEAAEFGDAARERDLIEMADALADLLYVTYGAAVELGIPIDEVFRQVHLSNMSKEGPGGEVVKDAGGKVLKPDTYKPVDLSWILDLQGDASG